MAVSLYHTGTEYVLNQITFTRGSLADVVTVGVYHSTTPTIVPAVTDFTTVTLADGTATPPNALAIAGQIDVVSLIGPKTGADLAMATPGDYQRFVLVSTAKEDIIRKVDVITVL
ncbi:MAG: hypothetical protein ACRDRN_24045 [Sciscionella sp.]